MSLFPGGSVRAKFPELKKYGGGKGTIKFPLDAAIPWGLIKKIVRFRAKEDAALAKKDTR